LYVALQLLLQKVPKNDNQNTHLPDTTIPVLSPEGMSGRNVISIVNVTEIGKFTGVKEWATKKIS
jgi:hypothetical protein